VTVKINEYLLPHHIGRVYRFYKFTGQTLNISLLNQTQKIPSKETSEVQLWKMFLSGEQNALSKLVALHYRGLYNYGFRFAQDGDFVKDCLQDLFMELWERREKLSETSSVKSYLLKALRHRMINESLRFKRFKMQHHLPFLSEANESAVESLIIETDSHNEQSLRLKNIISKLTGRQQEVIYLRFYHGLEYAEITQIMEMERQSVANLLHRSLKEIKAHWLSQKITMWTLLGLALN
jgi:RNA polymerase sigma factor (sigma-70 family)